MTYKVEFSLSLPHKQIEKGYCEDPSGTVSTYQQLHESFTHINEQESKEVTPLPDIAPAAVLQSISSLPYRHNSECTASTSTCDCILDTIPFE